MVIDQPLAQHGAEIELDIPGRRLELHVPDAELRPPPRRVTPARAGAHGETASPLTPPENAPAAGPKRPINQPLKKYLSY